MSVKQITFEELVDKVRACRVCAQALPLEPRPILQVSPGARLLVASQAPGIRAHNSGVPFSDASGDRLREWMGVTPAQFYDPALVAILPTGFCYPGKKGGGDAPPRRECAELWRGELLERMPQLRLTLLVGAHAQTANLGKGSMTERVRNFSAYLPDRFPLPHPSWRVAGWAQRNPWFETDVLPVLKREVQRALSE